jgi:NAD(P)-dependent dehydrogenase (short-subunit alcohol dehydrogenase family)
MTDLADKHALVTGGGSGIGAAIAVTLAQAGANVTICGRRMDTLSTTAARHQNIFAQAADVTEEPSVERLYQRAQSERGPFAIVVANAGGAQSAPAEKISRELWNDTVNLNLTAAFFCVQPAIPAMRERRFGRIVFIASTAGLKGYPYVAAYVAAKHGVVGLARALAVETARDGITVNAVCPGYTETPLLEAAIQRIAARGKSSEDDIRTALAADNPYGRFIQPQEVADVVLRLCADESAAVTGQAIAVTGGETW